MSIFKKENSSNNILVDAEDVYNILTAFESEFDEALEDEHSPEASFKEVVDTISKEFAKLPNDVVTFKYEGNILN